jgi:hypothetical protein
LSSIATLAAVVVALWVAISGPRPLARPKLLVSVEPEPPDCTWNPNSAEEGRDNAIAPGYYAVRLRISNEGKEDARDVEVMMTRLWIIDDDGTRTLASSFLPLLLPWSWWVINSSPERWLEKLPVGTFKHCDFLKVTRQIPQVGHRRLYSGDGTGPQSWITFQSAYDPSDPSGQSPMRKPPGRYQLEFIVAASNATANRWAANIEFTGWLDSPAERFGKDSGLKIQIKKLGRTKADRARGSQVGSQRHKEGPSPDSERAVELGALGGV